MKTKAKIAAAMRTKVKIAAVLLAAAALVTACYFYRRAYDEDGTEEVTVTYKTTHSATGGIPADTAESY